MLRIALTLIITLSAFPFAAAATRPAAVLSDVRAATARPQARAASTASATPMRPADDTSRTPTETPVPRIAAVGAGARPVPVETVGEEPSATPAPPPPEPPRSALDFVIAMRGDHRLRHDITVVPSLRGLSWARHATEDNKTLPDGNDTVAPWLVVERDASQIGSYLDVRLNIRNIRCYSYQPSTGGWIEIYSGLPRWMVSSDVSTADGYDTIAPVIEPDGSYSFDVPVERALHMASGVWRPRLSESGGILTLVEARLIGSDVDAARIAVAAGADFRTGDDYETTNQAGFGHFGLLTPYWQSYSMLSSGLSDDEIRANPPPVD